MCSETHQPQTAHSTPREAIAAELQTAADALERITEIDAEHDALTRAEREDVSIPMGRLRKASASLPDTANTP